MEALRQQAVGNLPGARFAEDEEAVFADRRVERGAVLLPVGQKLGQRAGVEDRAGKDMGTDFGTFFDQADRNLATLFR